ncbi:MAG: hypothetical protein ACLP1Q_12510 [Solirubrobacteraceae bacterium]
MTRKPRLVLVLVALAALAVSGCGSQAAAPRARLVAQADPICKQVNAKRTAADAAMDNATALTGPQGSKVLKYIARTASSLAAYELQAVDRLRALKAPASMAHEWQEMLTGLQQLANDTAQLGIYSASKNVKAGEKLLASSRQIRLRLIAIAARNGFAHCGRLT